MTVRKMTPEEKKAWLGNGLVMPGPKKPIREALNSQEERMKPEGPDESYYDTFAGRGQEMQDEEELLLDRLPSEKQLPTTDKPGSASPALPAAPNRESFPSQEEFEEAAGFWQSRVGRLRGMRGVKPTEASPDSAVTAEAHGLESEIANAMTRHPGLTREEAIRHLEANGG